jgi:hypothetical protein
MIYIQKAKRATEPNMRQISWVAIVAPPFLNHPIV